MAMSQDLFATPVSNCTGNRRRQQSSTDHTPPQTPSRSVKRRHLSQVTHYNGPVLVKEPAIKPKNEYYSSQSVRRSMRHLNKDDESWDHVQDYRRLFTQQKCQPQARSGPDVIEPNGEVVLSKEEIPVPHPECKKQYSSMFVCCGLSLLILISGFIGALCYSYVHEHDVRYPESPSLPEATGLNLHRDYMSAVHVQVNDVESSVRFLSAATQSQISQLKQSVQSLSQELIEISRACQNKQSEVLIERSPGNVYEELLGQQEDLASAWNLGSVLATPDTMSVEIFQPRSWWPKFLTSSIQRIPATTTIMGLIQGVGDCWMFAGQQGRLVLALHRPSVLTSVSITHIASLHDLSAPRHFSVLAHYSGENLEDGVSLGVFEYKKNGAWRQTFLLDPKIVKENLLQLIEFRFSSNHGDPNHTCIYRVHVHGLT